MVFMDSIEDSLEESPTVESPTVESQTVHNEETHDLYTCSQKINSSMYLKSHNLQVYKTTTS